MGGSTVQKWKPPPQSPDWGGWFSLSEPRGRRVATCGPRLSPLSRPGTHNALPAATPSFTGGRRGGLCVCVCALTTDFTAERRGFSVVDQPHATDQAATRTVRNHLRQCESSRELVILKLVRCNAI